MYTGKFTFPEVLYKLVDYLEPTYILLKAAKEIENGEGKNTEIF